MQAESKVIDLADRKHVRKHLLDMRHIEQLAMHEFARLAGPIIEELASQPLGWFAAYLQSDLVRAEAARISWENATCETERARWNARQENEG